MKVRSLLVALVACIAATTLQARKAPAEQTAPEHHSLLVNGIRLHFVTEGQGDPVLLIPGWPEDWFAWRTVMKSLAAEGHEAIALDPRGFGDSDKPPEGYDPDSAADDIHGFVAAAGLIRPGGIDVVAHDVGTWIAFKYAASYPGEVRRLVLSEATLPGVSPPPAGVPSVAANVKTWQFGFNRLDDLPETLVAGHERAFITWLFEKKSVERPGIDPASLDEFARVFASPGAARAGFSYYRRFFDDRGLAAMREAATRGLPMPVLAVGAEGGVGGALGSTLKPLAPRLSIQVIAGCGHYLGDECPGPFADAILAFWRAEPVHDSSKIKEPTR